MRLLKRFLSLSFSWIGESRPFSFGVRGPMAKVRASKAYTPTAWAGQKLKVAKKKKKSVKKRKSKK